MFIITLIIAFLMFTCFLYYKGKSNEIYWKKRGVVMYKKYKAGGPFVQYLFEDKSFFEILKEVYDKHGNEPAVGLGSLFKPMLYITHPTNIRHVLKDEFENFNHRGIAINKEDVLCNNIALLGGSKWKLIRQNISPVFTSAKLKNMFYIMDKSAQDLLDYLRQNPQILKNGTRNTLDYFCNAAIGAAIFGIGSESIFKSPFLDMVSAAVKPSFALNFRFSIAGTSDALFKATGWKLFGDHEDFFIPAIRKVIKQREMENVKKYDYADICVKLQKSGTMKDAVTGLEIEPSDELLAAQAFFFFLAGVDSSSSAMFAALLELGRHPVILKRVLEDIDMLFEKYGEDLTYDAILGMDYLEKVLDESLRLHPAVGFLTRRCVKASVLPVGNIPVDENTNILIPIYELHHDPKYFPNPEVFDPERFENGKIADNFTYMPFGTGKRYCLAKRYVRIQVVCGLVRLLRCYTPKIHIQGEGYKYKKQPVQVQLKNVDIELIPRNSNF